MKTFTLLFLTVCFFCSSCASLEHIHVFSTSCLSGINHFTDLNHGFEQNCLENCQFKIEQKAQIEEVLNCNCTKSAQADSINTAIFNVLYAYFSGLSKLSDNHSPTGDFTPVANQIQKLNWLDARHTKAYSNLANILLEASTNGYRRKQLKAYIGEADISVQILLRKLESNFKINLINQMNTKNTRLTVFYQDAVHGKSITEFQKVKIAEEYYRHLNENNDKKQNVLTFCTGLSSIAAAHQKLFRYRAQMNDRETKDWIIQYVTNIQIIFSDFNKLRNP